MSNLRRLQSALFANLGDALEIHGFRRGGPNSQSFRRAIDGGEQAIHLSIIEHDEDFDVAVDVAVRFDELEQLLDLDPPPQARGIRRFSLGGELGNIRDGRPIRWTVANEWSIPLVSEEIRLAVEEVGEPYLEEYSQPRRALEVLRNDTREAWLHSPIHVERAKRAVALSLLLDGPQEAASVAREKSAFLETAGDPMRKTFGTFLSRLGIEPEHPKIAP